jgi:hypothetical protein
VRVETTHMIASPADVAALPSSQAFRLVKDRREPSAVTHGTGHRPGVRTRSDVVVPEWRRPWLRVQVCIASNRLIDQENCRFQASSSGANFCAAQRGSFGAGGRPVGPESTNAAVTGYQGLQRGCLRIGLGHLDECSIGFAPGRSSKCSASRALAVSSLDRYS